MIYRFNKYTIYLLFVAAQFSFSQSVSDSYTKTKSFKITNETKPFFDFGFETSFNTTLEKKIKFYQSFYGYLDINLSRKIYYLKNELGSIIDYDSNSNLSFYASSGLSLNVFRPDKNNLIYFHSALFAVINKTGGGFSFFLSMRYLHKFNKILGLATSVRYPMGRLDAISFTIGIQFY